MKINARIKKISTPLFVASIWLTVWAAVSAIVNSEVLFPSPPTVAKTLIALSLTGSFWKDCLLSVSRIFGGFALGITMGTVLAFLTYFVPFCASLFKPLLSVIRATPVTSFILLVVLWLPSGITPVFISFLIVLPIMWGNVYAGLGNVDKNLTEITRVYKFSLKNKIKYLYVQAVSPYFEAGCRTSLGLAWKAGVAAEVLCFTKNSIGLNVFLSKNYLETPKLFAWTAMVIIISVGLEKIIGFSSVKVKTHRQKMKINAIKSGGI